MDWAARFTYLGAKQEQRQIELYGMDLVWLIASRYYNSLAQPSEVANRTHLVDTRSAKQIVEDILGKVGVSENGTVLAAGETHS